MSKFVKFKQNKKFLSDTCRVISDEDIEKVNGVNLDAKDAKEEGDYSISDEDLIKTQKKIKK